MAVWQSSSRWSGITLLCLVAACSKAAPPRVSGTQLLKSPVANLYESADGAWVATLASPEATSEPGAPKDIQLGSLWLIPADKSPPRRLGGEVSNLAGSVLFSADSAFIAFVGGYSVRHGAGALRLARTAGGEVEELGDGVTFFSFSPNSEWIAWVSDGVLSLRRTASGPAKRVTDGVSVVEFGPKGTPAAGSMLIKRSARKGGALLLDDLPTGKLTAIARGATAFGFAPNGEGLAFECTALLPPTEVERRIDVASSRPTGPDAPGLYRIIGHDAPRRLTTEPVTDFKFSPVGTRLAYLSLPSGAPTGDLFATDGATPARVATKVSQMQFAADGSLVLLGSYDAGGSRGTLGISPPKGDLVQVAENVRQFSVSPKGGYIFYSQDIYRDGALSIGFAIHKLGAVPAAKPDIIDEGVFGYSTEPNDARLAYKAHCTDSGKSCNLFIADLAKGGKAEQLAGAIEGFEFGPEGMVVVSTRREADLTGRLIFALGYQRIVPNAPALTLDDNMSGEFALVGSSHHRVVYLVNEPGREGVYAADLREPPPVVAAGSGAP
jgi:hypothetical protein